MSNKQNIFSIRLSDEEVAKLKALAEQASLRESTIVRRLIMSAHVEPVNVVVWSVKTDPVNSLILPN